MESRKLGGLLLTVVSSLASGVAPLVLKGAPRAEVDAGAGLLLASTLVGVALMFFPTKNPARSRGRDVSRVAAGGVAVQGSGHTVNVVQAAMARSGDSTAAHPRAFLHPVITPETIEKLFADYTAIQARPLAKVYEGKLMRLAGCIHDMQEQADGSITLDLKRPENSQGVTHCRFNRDRSSTVEALPKGYGVVVTGAVDLSGSSVTLIDCELG